jgi:hypothetical protein
VQGVPPRNKIFDCLSPSCYNFKQDRDEGMEKSILLDKVREINMVMLATSLAPDGYFTLS